MLILNEFASISSGVPARQTENGPARFVRLSDLSEIKLGRHPPLARGEAPAVARALAIQEGDLIVGARGPATDVCLASDAVFGAFISLDLYLVRPDKAKVDPRYLAAFLELPSTQVSFASGKQGSGLARLPKEALDTLPVPVPGLRAQQAIAGLALLFAEERRLLKKLADLRSLIGRETIARAIRAADPTDNSTGSST